MPTTLPLPLIDRSNIEVRASNLPLSPNEAGLGAVEHADR